MDHASVPYETYVDERFDYLYDGRPDKPRNAGITMIFGDGPFFTVFDRSHLHSLLNYAGLWIDWYKFNVGAIVVQPPRLVEEKLELLDAFGVEPFPGGNLFEMAIAEGRTLECLQTFQAIGFPRVEVSSTAIDLGIGEKATVIEQAVEMGFEVHAEVGTKREAGEPLPTSAIVDEMAVCLDAGADSVILDYENVEVDREGERDRSSALRPRYADATETVDAVLERFGTEAVVFELPWTHEAGVIEACAWLINNVGPDVNIGNATPTYVNKIEQLRRGIGVRVSKNQPVEPSN